MLLIYNTQAAQCFENPSLLLSNSLVLILRYAHESRHNNTIQVSESRRHSTLRKIAIPTVLDLGNLLSGSISVDLDDTLDDFLGSDTLDLVARLRLHSDGVSGRSDGVVLLLDLGEGGFESPPLRLVLFTALSFGYGVGKCGVVLGVLALCS